MNNPHLLYTESFAPIMHAYIDPGTGSMLFSILVGLIGIFSYSFKSLLLKIGNSFGLRIKNNEHYDYSIYTDSKRYWYSFKSICDGFEKRKIEILYLTQSEDDPVFKQNYSYVKPKYIGEKQSSFKYLNTLNSDILLSTTPSLDVFQWKRSKYTKYYVHIPHACSDIVLYRMFGIDYYDSILVSGEFQIYQIRELEKKRKLPSKELKIVGLTYFDEMKNRLDRLQKIRNETPVILVAPSWGSNSILNRYGRRLIDELVKTGYKIIIRPHPQSFISEKEMIERIMSFYPNIEWNMDDDNFDILYKSDLLISDFSGVIFDFALVFNKPVIYANVDFDDSVYDAYWIDEPLWTFRVLPKIGKQLKEEEFDSIKTVIDECLNNSTYNEERKKAISESWSNIGKSSEIIIEYLLDKHKQIIKEETV